MEKFLLDFKKYEITDAGLYYHLNDEFLITHGTRAGQQPAKGELDVHGMSGMSGHSHKSQVARKNLYQKTIEWVSIGCLANFEELTYASTFAFTWDQSFAEIDYTQKNHQVLIHKI